jgi:translation initiation factor IF-2
MTEDDRNHQPPAEPVSGDSKSKFSKVLSLGDFKQPATKIPPSFVKKESSVTVEVRRKRTPFVGGLYLSRDNKTGFSAEDLKERVNLIAQAEKEASNARSKAVHTETKIKEASEDALAAPIAEKFVKAEAHKPYRHFDDSEKDLQVEVEDKTSDGLKLKQSFKGRRDMKRIIIHKIDLENEQGRRRSLASIKRNREKAKHKSTHSNTEFRGKLVREIVIPEQITVSELASRMAEKSSDVMKKLLEMGMTTTINQIIDSDTAELIVSEFGHNAKVIKGADVEKILSEQVNAGAELVKRPPVVTVMGHIDHGKTSLLDALRSTDVISSEAGGITQHIGAYQVQLKDGDKITFIDTPGHEVFTSMRLRGASITDLVILVVAADDGVKEQTIESINHAKAAKVPMIIAINKIDKVGANPQQVLRELLQYDCVTESMGGDIMAIEVSALKKQNLDKLEAAILLQAEMLELKARVTGPASGAVIESKIDKNKGAIVTVLVQQGSLHVGDIVVAGPAVGRVRTMRDDKNKIIKEALPSSPVEITGLEVAPQAGDTFNVLENEKQARDISDYRMRVIKKQKETDSTFKFASMEDMFTQTGSPIELAVIIKADTQGSVEAIAASLARLSTDKVKLIVLHKAVGGINESDIALAKTAQAIVLGFNVGTDTKAKLLIQQTGTDVRNYSIIYNLIEDVRSVMEGKLFPVKKEKYLGRVDIRQVFNVSKVGKIGGGLVLDGIIRRNAAVKLLRDGIVVHEGTLKTLKRFKDDAKEVSAGYECGFTIDRFDDIKEGDVIEAYEIVEEKGVL